MLSISWGPVVREEYVDPEIRAGEEVDATEDG
jgi:hypothetical protein